MENNSSKTQFIQQLIDESLQYQILYKAEKSKNDVLDATIKTLQTTIADKDSEIKNLKQKNMKHLMEIGVQASRYNTLTVKYEDLDREMYKLSIKYDELYQKFVKAEELHLQNLRVLINECCELSKKIEYNNILNLLDDL